MSAARKPRGLVRNIGGVVMVASLQKIEFIGHFLIEHTKAA
jgi:hypothetical protein